MDDTLKEKFFEEFESDVIKGQVVRFLEIKNIWQWIEANTIPKVGKTIRTVNKFDLHAASIAKEGIDTEFTPTEVSVTPNDNVVESKPESECSIQVSDEYIEEFPGKLLFELNGEDKVYIPKDKVKEIVESAFRSGADFGSDHGVHFLSENKELEELLQEILKQHNLDLCGYPIK